MASLKNETDQYFSYDYDFIARELYTESTISPFVIEYFVVSAIIGILSVEYAFAQTKRARNVDEKRDGAYPLCRRLDVQRWARWKFYPGAMLFMPLRVVAALLVFLLLALTAKVMSAFHNFERGPIIGLRKVVIKRVLHYEALLLLAIAGMRYEKKHIDFDYSKYLGPDYKNDPKRS